VQHPKALSHNVVDQHTQTLQELTDS